MTATTHERTALLSQQILTLGTAKPWLEALVRMGLDFHLEDDPADLIHGPTGQPTFAESEVPLVRERVRELYAIDWAPEGVECPIGYMVKITGGFAE